MARLRDTVRRRILDILLKRLTPADWDVTLFGSFARGTATVASDIDIAVRGPVPLSGALAERIVADLEEGVPMLRDYDLVDLSRAQPALRDRVAKEGETWHRATTTA